MLGGSGGTRPSGGFSGVMSGIGTGIGALLTGSWKKTIGSFFFCLSKLKDNCSTLVCASMLAVSAGCGAPTLISGPQ